MSVITKALEYKDSDGTLFEGFLCYPSSVTASHKLPGVLVHHAFGGCGKLEQQKAVALAKLGFIALAVDVYGKGIHGSSVEENFSLMRPLISERSSLLKRRLLAAVSALQTVEGVDQDKIGAIGFCFGGLCALDLARHRIGLKAAVSFHGTLTAIPELELDHIDTSIQVHHGDADPHIKAESVAEFMQEMRTRKADWSFISYGNAQHGFTEPQAGEFGVPGVDYNKEADNRSWVATIAFLKEKLLD